MVPEGGPDPLSGGGERDADGQDVREELDLTLLPPRLRARFERQAEADRRMSRGQREALAGLLPEGQARFDEPMARHSAAGVGGPAEVFVCAATMDELRRVLAWATEETIDYRLWGAGSSLLVRDGGVSGIAIALGEAFNDVAIERTEDAEAVVRVGAATPVAKLLAFCEAQGLTGVGPMARERGTVGGALCASGDLFGEALAEITIMTKEGRELTLTRQALRFEEGRLRIPRTAAIVRALLRFARRAPGEAPVAEVKAMVPEGAPLCFERVFASPCKTPASVLIEEAGLPGVRVGSARVSVEDANAILNEGRATARDIVVLLNLVRDRVREQSGVTLVPAIEVVGER